MGQKQGLRQEEILAQELDYIDMMSVCEGIAGIAAKLVEKHKGDLKAIEKEISEIEVPVELADIEGLNYKEEILWNAKYLIEHQKTLTPGLMAEGKNPIFLHFQRNLEESSHVPIE